MPIISITEDFVRNISYCDGKENTIRNLKTGKEKVKCSLMYMV